MRSSKLPHYLRSHRKRLGFSQGELAFLLGCRTGAKVSHYERFARTPNLETMFAYAVIFQMHGRELFAGVFESAQVKTCRRARLLIEQLSSRESDPATFAKLSALRMIACPKVVLESNRASA